MTKLIFYSSKPFNGIYASKWFDNDCNWKSMADCRMIRGLSRTISRNRLKVRKQTSRGRNDQLSGGFFCEREVRLWAIKSSMLLTNSMNETSSRLRKGPKWPIIMIYFLLVVTCYRVNRDNAAIILRFRGWINYRTISENKKRSNHTFSWWIARKCSNSRRLNNLFVPIFLLCM